MRDLIRQHGGPARFRHRLASIGVEIPRVTVECWSAGRTSPPQWVEALIRLVL